MKTKEILEGMMLLGVEPGWIGEMVEDRKMLPDEFVDKHFADFSDTQKLRVVTAMFCVEELWREAINMTTREILEKLEEREKKRGG